MHFYKHFNFALFCFVFCLELVMESDNEGDQQKNVVAAHAHPNLLFLTGKIKCEPSGDYIYNIHKHWRNDHRKLERHHGYIQWLFPLEESGLNKLAVPLSKEELQISKSIEFKEIVKTNLLNSYEMMLNFFGMRLVDESAKIARDANWREAYGNLLENQHNSARITRIIKCLGLFELEEYQNEFVKFLIHEVCETKALSKLYNSLRFFWIDAVNDATKIVEYREIVEAFHCTNLKGNSQKEKGNSQKEKGNEKGCNCKCSMV